MKWIVIVLSLILINVSEQYCSNEICRRCCTVSQTGCYNSFDEAIGVDIVTDYTFCQDCECSDSKIGCGWMGYNFGRVECASCDTLKRVVINGCGKISFNGDLVFTPMPNPVYLP